MENNNLYKSTSLNSFNSGISNSPIALTPKFNINSSTHINNKNLKLNLYDETYRKFSKVYKFNKSISSTNYNFYKFSIGRAFHGNISCMKKESEKGKKELSVSLFQNNDVELVRNLNPDSDKDLCSNSLLKEKLKNKIESNINISLLLNTPSKIRSEEKRYTLPKLNYISIDTILESNKNIKNLKKELQQNKQSNLLEKDLNKKLKQINDITSLKKKNKTKIYDNFKKLLKEIDNIGYDIQFLNQQLNEKSSQMRRGSYYDKKKGRRRSSIKLEALNNANADNDNIELNNYNIQNNNDKFNKLSLMQSLYKDQKKKDFEKKMKVDKIGKLKKELKQLKTPLKSINNEINELKHVEKNIKQRLMRHYQELLYNGKEVRNEGLSWIIKAIWRLGENVPMSFMPTFLDFSGIKYLFNIARLSVELDAKKKFLIELKINLKKHIINSYRKKEKETDNDTKKNNESVNDSNSSNDCNDSSNQIKKNLLSFKFKTNIFFKNKKLTHSSSQPKYMRSFYQLNKKFKKSLSDKFLEDENDEIYRGTIKEMSKIFEENENSFNFINSPAVIKIKNLEKIKEIEMEIKNLKKFEIQRIFKEFIDYDYENKYHTSIDVVLGALIGEHSKNIQVNKFNVFKKGYFDEIKNIRFYEYAKRNGWVS